jgi:hypothetical protein
MGYLGLVIVWLLCQLFKIIMFAHKASLRTYAQFDDRLIEIISDRQNQPIYRYWFGMGIFLMLSGFNVLIFLSRNVAIVVPLTVGGFMIAFIGTLFSFVNGDEF